MIPVLRKEASSHRQRVLYSGKGDIAGRACAGMRGLLRYDEDMGESDLFVQAI